MSDDKDKILPIGFVLDSKESIPEGFFLDGDAPVSIPEVIIQSDETLLNLLEWHKSGGAMPEITILDEYSARVLRLITETQGKPAIIQGNPGPIGKTGPLGDRGPMGPKGELGPKGDVGDLGVSGPRGQIGPKGIPGPEGKVGPLGNDGKQGEEGPPLEWEFCEVDGIDEGGIRLRQTDGEWSKCKRIVGKSGKRGEEGEPGIAERAYGAGHGGGGGSAQPQNLLPGLHQFIAPGATEIVGSLYDVDLLAAKWFLSVIEEVTENNHATEIFSRRKGNEVAWSKGSSIGDRVRYSINLKIVGDQYILEITNNESNNIKVDGVVIPIKR